jgi:Zn-dependent protease
MSGNTNRLTLLMGIMTIPVVLISLCFHELSHGYIAYKLGDPTAKIYGRLTMNPMSHLDPLGTISMMLFGIGWAKPVPVNARNFRNPKKGMAITGLAGPVSNLILSFISLLLYRIIATVTTLKFKFEGGMIYYLPNATYSILDFVALFLIVSALLNVSLAVFNLIPIPPLDGSKVLNALLPARIYFKIMQYERYGTLLLILFIWFGSEKFLSSLSGYVLDFYDFVLNLIPFLR